MNTSNAASSSDLRAFVPKIVTAVRDGYSSRLLRADSVAALISSGTMIPVILALTVQAGLSPEGGMIGAGVALGIAALLGGSSFQSSAPTVLLLISASPVLATYGETGLGVATAMASAILLVAAVARWHAWIRYVPASLLIGLEVGAVMVLVWRQLGDALGLDSGLPFGSPGEIASAIGRHASDIHALPVGVLAGSLSLLLLIRHVVPRWPAALLAMVGASVATAAFGLPVETLGDRLRERVDGTTAHWLDLVRNDPDPLLSTAFTLAFVIGVQSLRGARVADAHSGRWHRARGELLAQGVANAVVAAIGGLPVSGDPARALENVKAGAQSPFSALLTGWLVLAAAVLVPVCADFVPIASLSAALLAIAWDVAGWPRVREMLGGSRTDHALAAMVALLIIFVGAGAAVGAGIVLTALLVLHRRWRETTVRRFAVEEPAGPPLTAHRVLVNGASIPVPAGVEVFQVCGSLVFESAHQLSHIAPYLERGLRALILDVQRVTCVDATGREALEDLLHRCQRQRTILVLAQLGPTVRAHLSECGLFRANRLVLAHHVPHAVRIVEALTADAPISLGLVAERQ